MDGHGWKSLFNLELGGCGCLFDCSKFANLPNKRTEPANRIRTYWDREWSGWRHTLTNFSTDYAFQLYPLNLTAFQFYPLNLNDLNASKKKRKRIPHVCLVLCTNGKAQLLNRAGNKVGNCLCFANQICKISCFYLEC